MKYKVEVTMEGSKKPLLANVDGRDIRAWETKHSKSFLHETLSYTMMVELAYTALQRDGKTDLSWAEFDATCTWAADVSGKAENSVDPTPKARGGGSSRK